MSCIQENKRHPVQIAINHTYAHLPPRQPIESFASRLGLSNAQVKLFRRYHGFDTVAIAPDSTLTDLLSAAVSGLVAESGVDRREITHLFHCHTALNLAPYPSSYLAEVKQRVGLQHARAVALSMAHCATPFVAMDIAAAALASYPGSKAVIVAGEKCSARSIQLIEGSSIMGEATAAALVSRDGTQDRVESLVVRHRGEFALMEVTPDRAVMQAFNAAYMGGLAAVIEDALAAAGARLGDMRLIIPHNVNRSSWKTFAEYAGIDFSRIYLANVPRLGHCFGADAFLNHADATKAGLLAPGDRYLMVSVGLGATYAAAVMRR